MGEAAGKECRVGCWWPEVHFPEEESNEASGWGASLDLWGTKMQVSSCMKGMVLGVLPDWQLWLVMTTHWARRALAVT